MTDLNAAARQAQAALAEATTATLLVEGHRPASSRSTTPGWMWSGWYCTPSSSSVMTRAARNSTELAQSLRVRLSA